MRCVATLLEGNLLACVAYGNSKAGQGCVCLRAPCGTCAAAACVPSFDAICLRPPWGLFALRLPVPLQLMQGPRHGTPGRYWAFAQCPTSLLQLVVVLL